MTPIVSYMNPIQSFVSCFLQLHCNLNFPCSAGPPKWSLFFRYLLCFHMLSHVLPCPALICSHQQYLVNYTNKGAFHEPDFSSFLLFSRYFCRQPVVINPLPLLFLLPAKYAISRPHFISHCTL